jgi:predicted transcriptional regulator
MPKRLSKRIQRIRLAAIMGIVRLEPYTDACIRDRYTINGVEVTAQLRWLCERDYLHIREWEPRSGKGGPVRFDPGRSPP